jgi:hypothetical protein
MMLLLWPVVAFADPGPGSIAGTITAAGGTPVSGASVCAFDFYTYSLVDCDTSGADGSYLISGLPASDYRVEASAAGYAYEMYDDYQYGGLSLATPVTVIDDTTTSGIDFELEPGGDVSGTVYESDGVTPIEDVSVMIVFPDGSSRGNCTNASGQFSIQQLPYGVPLIVKAYSVGNYCGGPENYFTEYWDEVPVEAAATPIILSAGTPNAPGTDFTLDDGADTSGRIFGYVTEEATGDPVSGAYICAFDFYTYGLVDCVTSGADGSYLISGLPASDYRVEVSAAGYAYEMYNDFHYGGLSSATPVAVYQTMTTGLIDFELEPGGDVSGTVYESDGVTPIEDVSVMIIFPDGSSRGNCTDASGHYTIGDLLQGIPLRVYAFSVGNYCGGPENYFTEYWEEVPLEALASEITLSGGSPNVSGIDFTLDSGADTGGQIFGFVTDEATGDPIPGARVCAFNFDTLMQWDCVTSGADGSYLISGMPAADYRLEVHAAGYAFEMYDSVLYGPVDAATPVAVEQGLITNGIDFELEPGGNVSGTVYESDGITPIEDVSVVIIYPDGSIRGSCTDAGGNYSSEVYTLPYGVPVRVKAYAVGNYCGGPQDFFDEYWQEVPLESLASEITLSAGTPNAPGTDFTLDDGAATSGRIFGFVTDEATSDPIPGATVCAFNFTTYSLADCVTSGSDGSYLLSGLPGDSYRVEVSAAGYAYEMYDDLQYGPLNSATPVTVIQGSTTTGIDFELEPGGDVNGTVYGSDGVTSIENISVMLVFPDGSSRGSCTDINGQYNIGQVPYGVPLLVKAYAVGNYCGGPEDFFTEFWQEAEVEADSTALVLSSGTPLYAGIDFTLTQFVYTPTGTDVVVNPDPDVTITFDEVTSPGGTSAEALPGGDPPPPDGFNFMGTYYEIRSEAEFTTAQVCFSYDDSGLTPFEEAGLLLYHYEGGAWVNVTDPGYPDVVNNVICGTVSEFSPFGLMVPLNQSPVCDAAFPSQNLLWPANHTFRPIEILGVIDPDGDPVTITIDSIFQDEAVNAFGSGHTSPDGQGVGTSTAYVRAERSGFGNGRVYHIGFTADDGRGGTCSGTVLVSVPLHRGPKGAPVDDGALYDSTEIPTPVKHYHPWARLMFRLLSRRWMRWH